MDKYNPQDIEKKWQKYWEENKTFQTPEDVTSDNKYYILPQLPYPSGSGLHVGHAEVYTACDIFARYQRMTGKKVLQVIGWDSFGLPAENYAIKNNIHPKISTDNAIDNFRKQIKALGISVDWDREVGSHNADYYKFTQWFFLLFYKRGLVYRKKQAVNWCNSCKTVLANDQVKEGLCERCDTVIIQKEMEQWYIKITDYAERLLQDIDNLDWPEETKKRQKDWIGKSSGAEVDFVIKDSDFKIRVFTTRPDTLFGATYMVLAPEGKYIQSLLSGMGNEESGMIENKQEVLDYIEQTKKKTELDRQIEKEKIGIELQGIKAVNPVSKEEIPIFVADYVIASYGTGAIMAVPAHDERDFEFAKKYNLQIKKVVLPPTIHSSYRNANDVAAGASVDIRVESECFFGEGDAVNSDFLNGSKTEEAKEKMIEYLKKNNIGNRKVQYKLRDWSVSRQRFWGAPIPMLRNENTGELKALELEDLPVLLPEDVDFKPTGQSPLTYSKTFQEGVEEKYGKGWKREVDTLDTFMCSSWYYYRYLDPKNEQAFASEEALKKWMPVDFYLGGPEHVNGHLLYSRFFTKVLFDEGLIDFDEPFKVHRHQGLILGPDNRKMSKRWGNVINPTDVTEVYGADTLRMYEMFMGPLEEDKPWDENGVKGVRRFLDKVWNLSQKVGDHKAERRFLMNKTILEVTHRIKTLSFNTAVSAMMVYTNSLTNHLNEKDEKISREDFEILLLLLSPFAPHLCEELWNSLGHLTSINQEKWPELNEDDLKLDKITLVVQVNGKVRDSIDVPAEISEEDIKVQVLALENVKKWLEGKEPKKVIYVKGRLVSIVV